MRALVAHIVFQSEALTESSMSLFSISLVILATTDFAATFASCVSSKISSAYEFNSIGLP